MSYSTGIVYKIICNLDNKFCYIGSTFSELRHRWQLHKHYYKKWVDEKSKKKCYCSCFDYFEKFGIENFKIIKIKEYMCYREHKQDNKHLHAYEQLWINKTKICCNKHHSFNPLYKENKKGYQKEHYQNNKEKINEKNKEHYQNNKQQIKEYHKEYYETNKNKINQKRKEKIQCDRCGSIVIRSSLPRHKKSKKCLSQTI